ncbi:hypothetical protein [Streptomyces acidiscabies]|uniref:hypothetical protein n=1 Tax=Streptomyces acidiscabies TaxID=42234 RepID=UPI000950C08A|nr:hypothetical protein [Streptomyces acidiscabies]
MSEYPEIAARFTRDTTRHQMIVLHDDGFYRHLRFTNRPLGYGEYWFDLITWPGCLTIRGDFGDAYTFSRLPDMFKFFRGKGINPHYWAEKLSGGRESVKEYSEDKLRQLVTEYFVDGVRYGDAPRGLGKAVREEILNSGDLYDESLARQVVDGFEYGRAYKASCLCGAAADFDDEYAATLWRSRHIKPGHGPHVSELKRVEGIARYDRVRKYGLTRLVTPVVAE